MGSPSSGSGRFAEGGLTMSHVCELNRTNVRMNIDSQTIGSYLLGYLDPGERFIPMYPGRSDTNLQSRLLTHASNRIFTHFRFFPTRRVKEAYLRECRDYHDLLDQGITNVIHPRRPRNLHYERPFCKMGGESQ